MMKKILQIVFWVIGLVFCFLIYRSIMAPIEFNKVKTERYTEVIKKLKDIRAAQEAYFLINGKYADNFDELTKFIETAHFTITSQRDTSWNAYDNTFKIEVMKQGVVIDTLGKVSVKDSLFKDSDRYKDLRYLPDFTGKGAKNEQFTLKVGTGETNDVQAPVFEVSVLKADVLRGLDPDLVKKEIDKKNDVSDVKGESIKVGSLDELNTNGNWPTSYDAKIAKKQQ